MGQIVAVGLAIALLVAGCGENETAPEGTAVPPGTPENAPDSGKWRRARTVPKGASTDEALLTLPYLQGYSPATGGTGVLRLDAERVEPGVNLYVSGHAAEAVLIDLQGEVLHRWQKSLFEVWPELAAGDDVEALRRIDYWRRARLLPDGGLLAIFEGLGLVRLDRESRILWTFRSGCHHDLEILDDGTIAVLDRRAVVLPRYDPEAPILEDLVSFVSPEGELLGQISILEALERSPWARLLEGGDRTGDFLHTNTIELLDRRAAEELDGVAPGSFLLSILGLDAIAALDPSSGEIAWAVTGSWRRQHQPTVVEDGRILLFDNLGPGDRSRAIEIEPATGEIVWSWPEPPDRDLLYSKTLGSVQRLGNGNTLVTESENGRAVEVTRDGEIVWELVSPHRAGDRGELVATLFEVTRLPADDPGVTRVAS